MAKMKYIVVKKGSFELPYIFSELVNHSDVARQVAPFAEAVLGAGFCDISGGKFTCYGESLTLSIKSRKDVDSGVLNNYLIEG